jgi:hypothetical protein
VYCLSLWTSELSPKFLGVLVGCIARSPFSVLRSPFFVLYSPSLCATNIGAIKTSIGRAAHRDQSVLTMPLVPLVTPFGVRSDHVATASTHAPHAPNSASRRDIVAATLCVPVLLVGDSCRAASFEGASKAALPAASAGPIPEIPATSVVSQTPPVTASSSTTVPLKPKLFIARDFLFAYPRGWRVVEDTEALDRAVPDRRRQNVVRGEVVGPDGITASVIQQQASKLKQSLTTITDLKQLGSLQEVSKLVLPPGTIVDSAATRSIPVPSKDTGISAVGVIERDPVTIYRYSVRLSNGVRSEVAVGILLGRVLILGAGYEEGSGGVQQQKILVCKAIADSFKILPKA